MTKTALSGFETFAADIVDRQPEPPREFDRKAFRRHVARSGAFGVALGVLAAGVAVFSFVGAAVTSNIGAAIVGVVAGVIAGVLFVQTVGTARFLARALERGTIEEARLNEISEASLTEAKRSGRIGDSEIAAVTARATVTHRLLGQFESELEVPIGVRAGSTARVLTDPEGQAVVMVLEIEAAGDTTTSTGAS